MSDSKEEKKNLLRVPNLQGDSNDTVDAFAEDSTLADSSFTEFHYSNNVKKRPSGGDVLFGTPPVSSPPQTAGEVIKTFCPTNSYKGDVEVSFDDVLRKLDMDTELFRTEDATNSVKYFFGNELNSNIADEIDANPNAGTETMSYENQVDATAPSTVTTKPLRGPAREQEFRYPMNKPERGCFVIFNQEIFDIYNKYNSKYSLPPRTGTKKDADNLILMAEQLGFEYIKKINDATKLEIMEWIYNLSNADHSGYDCFACAILTHGGDRDVLYARDEAMKLTDFTRPFGADRCRTLAMKPKLFFIQACRGDKLDSGAIVLLSNKMSDDQVDSAPSSDSKEESQVVTIPAEADFLIANSTCPDYYAFRNRTNGSIFVQCLCSIFNCYGDKMELMQMMTRVNRMMAYDFTSSSEANRDYHNKKQIPSIATRLTAEVYFAPKRIISPDSDRNLSSSDMSHQRKYERQETETDSPCYDAGSYDDDSYHHRRKLFYPQHTKTSQIKKESALQVQTSLPSSSPIHASSSSRQIPVSTDLQSHRHLSNSRDDVSRSLDDKTLKQPRPEFLRIQPGNRNSEQRRSCPEVGRVVMRKDSYKIGGKRVAKSYVESDL